MTKTSKQENIGTKHNHNTLDRKIARNNDGNRDLPANNSALPHIQTRPKRVLCRIRRPPCRFRDPPGPGAGAAGATEPPPPPLGEGSSKSFVSTRRPDHREAWPRGPVHRKKQGGYGKGARVVGFKSIPGYFAGVRFVIKHPCPGCPLFKNKTPRRENSRAGFGTVWRTS